MEGYHCAHDLYALPLGDWDVAIGVDWSSTVNPVLWNFQLLTMKFQKDSVTYKLSNKPSTPPPLQEVLSQQLDKELCTSNLRMFLYSLENEKFEAFELDPIQLQELQKVRGNFEELFVLPTALSQLRSQDHKIPLIDDLLDQVIALSPSLCYW